MQTPPGDYSPVAYRVISWLLLLVMYAAAAFLALSPVALRDPDMWWHLRSAQWILSQHAFPHFELFSNNAAGRPWAAYSWGFELVLYSLYRHFQLVGIAGYTAGMVLLITAAVYRMVSRHSAAVGAVSLTLASVFAISPILTPRPWLFTVLFFTFELTTIFDARRTGNWRKLLFLIPLFAVWANFHIQFVYGLAVLALAAAEPLIARILYVEPPGEDANSVPISRWVVVLGASAVATLLTPYGLSLYRSIFTLAREQDVFNYVTEFYAPSFRYLGNYVLLLLGLAAAFSLGRRSRVGIFPPLLLVFAAVLAFRSQRDMWLLAVAAVALIAPALRQEVATVRQTSLGGKFALLVAVVAIAIGIARVREINNLALERDVAAVYPVSAVKAIAARHYSGPLINQFNWGGYLIWNLPSLPVSMDGRTDVYGPEVIRHSIALWDGQLPLTSDPELQRAGVIIGESAAPLSLLLRFDPRFKLVYQDQVASVFVPSPQAADAPQEAMGNKKVAP
jgi:hypothetical protein